MNRCLLILRANPPRYHYYYTFYVKIYINGEFFDEISYQLNPSRIEVTTSYPGSDRMPNPNPDVEYMKWSETERS